MERRDRLERHPLFAAEGQKKSGEEQRKGQEKHKSIGMIGQLCQIG